MKIILKIVYFPINITLKLVYSISIERRTNQAEKRGDPMTKERVFELARLALIDRWAEASESCKRYPDNWALKAKKRAIEKEIADLEEMKGK